MQHSRHAVTVLFLFQCSFIEMPGLQRISLGRGYLHSVIWIFMLMTIVSSTPFNSTTPPIHLTGHPTDGQNRDSSQLRMVLAIISAVVVVVIAPVTIITIFVVKRWKKGKHRNRKHDEDDTDTKLAS